MSPEQKEASHRQEASDRLSNEGRKFFNLIEFDSNEELIKEIRKHPIGLLLIVAIGAFVAVCLTVLLILSTSVDLDKLLVSSGANSMKGPLIIISLFLLIITLVGTLIGIFLYRSNVIYVTSEKIAQVQYASLFNRKISQLSIGDVQDVSVQQKGILAHIFNYGTLVVETAGEQQNYTFTFVPKPYETSKEIVGAHERNLVQYGN